MANSVRMTKLKLEDFVFSVKSGFMYDFCGIEYNSVKKKWIVYAHTPKDDRDTILENEDILLCVEFVYNKIKYHDYTSVYDDKDKNEIIDSQPSSLTLNYGGQRFAYFDLDTDDDNRLAYKNLGVTANNLAEKMIYFLRSYMKIPKGFIFMNRPEYDGD